MSASRDSQSGAVPFSYAQAAKGKNIAITPGQPAQAPTSSAKSGNDKQTSSTPFDARSENKTNWADDAADATTVVADSEHPATQNQHDENLETTGVLRRQKAREESRSTSPQLNASARSSTVKEEDEGTSPITMQSEELPWSRQPESEESSSTNLQESNVQEQQREDAGTAEKPSWSGLVEAPPPMVNVWAKRAEDAKTKQTSFQATVQATKSDISPPRDATPKRFSHPSMDGESASLRRTSVDRSDSDLRPSRNRNSIGPGAVPGSRRSSTKQQGPPNLSQFPSLQDSQLWPTPESAQDGVHRKSGEKNSDKPESDRPATSAPKSHGKNEWVHVPFTPTVKFETPIPTGSRRGARAGVRGGRDFGSRGASINGVSGTRATPSTSGESTNAAPSREGSAASVNRSPSTVRKDRPANGEYYNVTDVTMRGQSSGLKTSARDNQVSSDKNSRVQDSSNNFQDVEQVASEGDTTEISHQEIPESRKHTSDVGQNGWPRTTEGKPRRRSSRANEFELNNNKAGDRKRTSSINGGSKPGWADRRPETSMRYNDSNGDAHGSLSLRDRGDGGRSERGRGGRRNIPVFSPHSLPNLQINSGQIYFPNAPSSAKATTFHPSFSGSSTFPRAGRGGAGPRSASIPSDAHFGRYTSQHPGTPVFSSYAGPGYEFGSMPPTGPMPVNQFASQVMVMNGVANQLNYYFSLDNLCKDLFLRRHMDSQGFVPLKFVAEFARMKQLTTDFELIKTVASQITDFELHLTLEGGVYVRRRHGWADFVLAMNEREVPAQHDGPNTGERITQAGMIAAPLPGHAYAIESAYQSMQPGPTFTPFQPAPTASPVNGFVKDPNHERNSLSTAEPSLDLGHPATSHPMSGTEAASDAEVDEPDSFPDEKINDQITLFLRVSREGQSPHRISKSVSNGKPENAGEAAAEAAEERALGEPSKLEQG